MTVRSFAIALTLVAAFAAATAAQSTTPAPRTPAAPRAQTTPRPPVPPAPPAAPGEPAPPPPPPAPPRHIGQPVNIKVDVTITDQNGANAPVKKTVSIVTGDGYAGRIRSTANYGAIGNTPLNVDVQPEIVAGGKIRVIVGLQYSLPGNIGAGQNAEIPGAGPLRVTEISENLPLVLENGKAIVAAQSADPVGNRQVTIEITATILQ